MGGHFECKACSKEYKSQETYNTHLESHQKVWSMWRHMPGMSLIKEMNDPLYSSTPKPLVKDSVLVECN